MSIGKKLRQAEDEIYYTVMQIANSRGLEPDLLPTVVGAAFGRLKDTAITALAIEDTEQKEETDDGEHRAGD